MEETRVITGRFEPAAADWWYVPVELPAGVRELAVRCTYDRPVPPPGVPGNALDLGVFDERGHELGNAAGFRGWSGGSRDRFVISGRGATPGYLPGPVNPGRWHVVLGPYTVTPQGMRWTVEVTTRFGGPEPAFVPEPAPQRAHGRGLAWYRGDMHLHTVHSDGQRTPEELVAAARTAALDFVVSTEHNTSSASLIWGRHARPDLLIVDGEEVTTRDGHYLALGLPAGAWVDWRYRAVDGAIGRILGDIHGHGGLVVAAHPYSPCRGCSWRFGTPGLDGIEVWNGPWTADDELAVKDWDGMLSEHARDGRFIPAVANSDAHHASQAVGRPHNVVLAGDLERRAILHGVRLGRLWMAESAAVDLSLSATGGGHSAGIGDRLRAPPDQPVRVRLEVWGAPGSLVRLCTDLGQVLETRLPERGPGVVEWATTARRSAYVRAEVRRSEPTASTPDTMVALTNPVFLGRRPVSGRPPA
jgi:predicted metal-dependent phosphoesterase TrpH